MGAASLTRVCNRDGLRSIEPVALSVNGLDVVILRAQVGVRAFAGRCPHEGAPLGEGEIVGDNLVCRNHQWRFDVDTGQQADGPKCLASFPVIERDGDIFVDVRPLARNAAKRKLDDLPGPKAARAKAIAARLQYVSRASSTPRFSRRSEAIANNYALAPRRSTIVSATRQALAIIVSVGLAPVPVGNGEPSTM